MPHDSVEIEHRSTPKLQPVPRGFSYAAVIGRDDVLRVRIARPLGENDAVASGQRVQSAFSLLGDLCHGCGGWEFAGRAVVRVHEGYFVEEVLSGFDAHVFLGAERWFLGCFFFEGGEIVFRFLG